MEVVEIQISTGPKVDILGEEMRDNLSRHKQRGPEGDLLSDRAALGVDIVEADTSTENVDDKGHL